MCCQYPISPFPNTSSFSPLPHLPTSKKMRGRNFWTVSKLTVSASFPAVFHPLPSYSMLITWLSYAEMAPYYKIITSSASSSTLPLDQALLDSMEKSNTEELQRLDDRLTEAEKTEGETEISDALKARANHLTRIGDKVCIWS